MINVEIGDIFYYEAHNATGLILNIDEDNMCSYALRSPIISDPCGDHIISIQKRPCEDFMRATTAGNLIYYPRKGK